MSIIPSAADEWNARYPIGTRVAAFPITRDEQPLLTSTRTPAWTLGHGTVVVSVEGYAGGICLTHIDVIETPPLEQQIADIRAHAKAACPQPDGLHLDQWHEFFDIDPDLAGRDYSTTGGAR